VDEAAIELGQVGKDDEMGAINLSLGQAKASCGLVERGASFSYLAMRKRKGVDNRFPFGHHMTRTGVNNPGSSSGDTFTISHHG